MKIKLLFILLILVSSKSSRKGSSRKNPIIYNRKEKELKLGKNKVSMGVEYDMNNIKADASVTRSKKVAPGVIRDTTYSGGVGYTHSEDSKGISVNAGRTKTNRVGPQYTSRGTNHEVSVSKGKNGVDAQYTHTKTNRKGYKVGEVDAFRSNEKSHSFGIGGKNTKNEKSGRLNYERKNAQTRGVNVAGTEVSRTDFNKRRHELSGGVKNTKNGGKRYEGGYSQSRTKGSTHKLGQASYTHERERGLETKGGVTKHKGGFTADGSAKIYNKQTHTGKIGAIEGSYSKEVYKKYSGNAGIRTKKGTTTAFAGGKIESGQTHTGKIGGASVTAGTINSLSAGVKAYHGKKGTGVSANVRKETGAHGGFKVGNVKADGSVKRSDIANASVHMKKNKLSAKANYEQRYDGNAKARIGKNSYNARAYVSKNTYGALNARRTKNGGSVNARLGRQYSAGGNLKVNGKTVAKAHGNAGAEARAHFSVDKKKGVKAGVGGKAGANAGIDTPIGKINVNVKADAKFDVKLDKKGLHTDIGVNIRGGIYTKDKRTGKTNKIGGGVGINQKTHFEKGKVTKHYQAQAHGRVNNNQFMKKVTGKQIIKNNNKNPIQIKKPAIKLGPKIAPKVPIKSNKKLVHNINKNNVVKQISKIIPKVNPRPASKVAPKIVPKVTPRTASKVAPKIGPKVTPRTASKIAPKIGVKVTPRPVTKVAPRHTIRPVGRFGGRKK